MTLDGVETSLATVTTTGDGVHIVEARDADGHTATAVYLIDTSAPSNIVFTGIEAKSYPVERPAAGQRSAAPRRTAVSGVSGSSSPVTAAGYGKHTLTATATDALGHQATTTLIYVVVLQSGDILAPVTAPNNDQLERECSPTCRSSRPTARSR